MESSPLSELQYALSWFLQIPYWLSRFVLGMAARAQ